MELNVKLGAQILPIYVQTHSNLSSKQNIVLTYNLAAIDENRFILSIYQTIYHFFSLLNDNEYEHYAYCKRASFGGFLRQSSGYMGVSIGQNENRRMRLKSTKMEQMGQKPRTERLERFRDWLFGNRVCLAVFVEKSDLI